MTYHKRGCPFGCPDLGPALALPPPPGHDHRHLFEKHLAVQGCVQHAGGVCEKVLKESREKEIRSVFGRDLFKNYGIFVYKRCH